MFRPTGIKLDPHDGEPLYRQIVDQVIARIRSGAFPPGFRLPPTRTLARELDAHRNTIVRAFEELQSTGFIVSVVGRGTFVSEEPPAAESPASPPACNGLAWGSLLSRATRAEPLGEAKKLGAPYALVEEVASAGRLPVPNFAAGGIATPADAALCMALGAEAVFVGSGIFLSEDPSKRARAIVEATTHWQDPARLAQVSLGLGAAMPGLEVSTLESSERFATRGW